MNIDKDIEIVEKFIEETQEEYSKTLVDGKVYKIDNIPLEFKPTKELAKSIENVLKELKIHKKIAEKLAGYGFNCYYGSPLKFDSPEELIEMARREAEDEELARKEVLKDE